MKESKCPICGLIQATEPIKQWNYGSTKVKRYNCKCGKLFNQYFTSKSSWTIPRKK